MLKEKDYRPVIMLNSADAPKFCKSRCANINCTKHISKAANYKGLCRIGFLKGTCDCEGYISRRKRKNVDDQ